MKLPSFLRREKKDQIKYDFEADKGEFKVIFGFNADKSFMLKIFQGIMDKVPLFKNNKPELKDAPSVWSVPKEIREKSSYKVSKMLGLSNVFEDVKKDLPGFKAVHVVLGELTFRKLRAENYKVRVVFTGLCVGDE